MAVVSDNKKCQSLINAAAVQAQKIRDAVNALKAIRTAFQAANPDVTGTVLQGNTTALSNSINVIDTEITKAVWDTLIGGYVASHTGKALD